MTKTRENMKMNKQINQTIAIPGVNSTQSLISNDRLYRVQAGLVLPNFSSLS